jgi:hypothetical protein
MRDAKLLESFIQKNVFSDLLNGFLNQLKQYSLNIGYQ